MRGGHGVAKLEDGTESVPWRRDPSPHRRYEQKYFSPPLVGDTREYQLACQAVTERRAAPVLPVPEL